MLEAASANDESVKEPSIEAPVTDKMKAYIQKQVDKKLNRLKAEQETITSETSVDTIYNIGAKIFGSAIFSFYRTAKKDFENANPSNWKHTGTGSIIQAWIRLPCLVSTALIGAGAFMVFPETAGVLSGLVATLTGAPPFVSTSIATCMMTLGLPALTNILVSGATDLLIHQHLGGPDELVNTKKDRAFFAKQAQLSPDLIQIIEEASVSIRSQSGDLCVSEKLFEAMSTIRQGRGVEGLGMFTDITTQRIKTLREAQEKSDDIYQERKEWLKPHEALLNLFESEKNTKDQAVADRLKWHHQNLSKVNACLKRSIKRF